MKILVLEPYYGGSHKIFLDGLQAHVPLDFILLTLPARMWKWRMRLAAPFFAEKIAALSSKIKFDAVFCSSFVDVATLRSLLPANVSRLPLYTYFHENQFGYPVRKEDERDFHFGLTNLTTSLASDKIAFNSNYNMQTFCTGAERLLKICSDIKLEGVIEKIRHKSAVFYPGVDFSKIDSAFQEQKKHHPGPVIVWNHRWEHDKNPQLFFKTLIRLAREDIDFQLVILGQSFRAKPAIFSEALDKLRHRIIHSGFVASRDDYVQLLHSGDIVLSTARHEFYGMAVIEAVRAGCFPLLPARLSYPELFPAEFLYRDEELEDRLKTLLQEQSLLDRSAAKALTERFSWAHLQKKYIEWLCSPPS